ncbi:tRNA (N6-threonylcarbamoyladenosine(37)-N6)-methyltransferase TrmO [Kribbella sp. CA-247076]|uniref:tRNA (N6-threonylcarbamoyladenosine(37)-N6)-methyltransferase TrmO n=1 Tax=Kribbella sp. CA-247076 TaxID=3239941 RepID=UPI003D91F8D8
MTRQFVVRPIGHVESVLRSRDDAPRQPDEGAPSAWLVFDESVRDGLRDLAPGDRIIVITWFDRADREVLAVHPRDDRTRPETGVFSTRSPDRPNPLGLHPVTVIETAGLRVQVDHLEALDGTPVVDVKPVLGDLADR